jgi:hypothetical protein
MTNSSTEGHYINNKNLFYRNELKRRSKSIKKKEVVIPAKSTVATTLSLNKKNNY